MRHMRTATAVLATTATLGCGTTDYANNPRPPSAINVSAAITASHITVSPTRFGAGPIRMIIANETGQAHRVTIESNELGASRPGLKQSTGPINPDGTATLQVDVTEGDYRVSVAEGRVRPARLHVGRKRPSSQNQLLQP